MNLTKVKSHVSIYTSNAMPFGQPDVAIAFVAAKKAKYGRFVAL